MNAEDDLRKLIDLAAKAVAASHNGADFTKAYAEQSSWHDVIRTRCEDPTYHSHYLVACSVLLPNYRANERQPA